MNKLDKREVCIKIKEYNKNPINLATDFLTHKQFNKPIDDIDSKWIPAMVVTLDGLWATQLYRDGNSRQIISESLKSNWKTIQKGLKNLPKTMLHQNLKNSEIELILDCARQVFPYILDTKIIKINKKHFSFTTKFFHWCATNYFPIVDSRAKKAVIQLKEEKKIPSERHIRNSKEEPYISEYKKWLIFYRDLITNNVNILKDIQDCDKTTQDNSPFMINNTILRILDKYLYIKGGGGNR